MDDEARVELVRQLFAQMTCKLEDAAALAVQGQNPTAENGIQLAEEISALARDASTIAEAAAELLRLNPQGQPR